MKVRKADKRMGWIIIVLSALMPLIILGSLA